MRQVKRRSFLGLSATIMGAGLIAAKTGPGFKNGGQDAPGKPNLYAARFLSS